MDPMMNVLVEGRGRVEKGWTKGAYARDATGVSVNERSPKAVAWCASGAIRSVIRNDVAHAARLALESVVDYQGSWAPLVGFNDDEATTQADVLALYDRAIRSARSEVDKARSA